MIKLVLLVLLIITVERIYNGGLKITVDGKTHSIEVKDGKTK